MPQLLSIAADDVLSWKPCYGEKYVRSVLALRERWTALDILALKINASDRQWTIHRDEMLPRELWVWLQCDYAGSVIYLYEDQSPGDTTLRWCLEETRAAGAAARDAAGAAALAAARAARDAAGAAALAAAWDAAGAAALAAAGEAAWYARDAAGEAAWYARAAARDAARAAALAAAGAAESNWQIDHARAVIEGWRDWPDDDVRAYLDTLTPVEDWPIGGE